MTVKELIDRLNVFNPNLEVFVRAGTDIENYEESSIDVVEYDDASNIVIGVDISKLELPNGDIEELLCCT